MTLRVTLSRCRDNVSSLGSGDILTGNDLELPINLSMFLDCGRKPEYPEKTHACTGRTCKLHVGVWMNGLRVFKNGFSGNILGEGFQRILLEHREIEFRDKVNTQEVIRPVRRIAQELQLLERRSFLFPLLDQNMCYRKSRSM
uniref:Uncharacterized protein n=1 Tax=Amphiprion percula TaxID=161767 RepID=A0A3P8SC26_AMPPE